MPKIPHTTRRDAKSPDSFRSSDKNAQVVDPAARNLLQGLAGFEDLYADPEPEDQRYGFRNTVDRLKETYATGADVVLACSETADGVLCATAATYFAKVNPRRVRVSGKTLVQPGIFELIVDVQTYYEMAERVLAGFIAHVRENCPRAVRHGCHGGCRFGCIRNIAYIAADVDNPAMPDALFRYVKTGLDKGSALHAMEADAYTAKAYQIARSVSAECEHARQFIRFSELDNGVYFARFKPEMDVVPLVTKYFRRRMGPTPFVIMDERHGTCLLSVASQQQLIRLEPASVSRLADELTTSGDEAYIQAMWKTFYDALALPGRDKSQRGYDLRTKWMPKRLWTYLPELTPGIEAGFEQIPLRYIGKEAGKRIQKNDRNLLG